MGLKNLFSRKKQAGIQAPVDAAVRQGKTKGKVVLRGWLYRKLVKQPEEPKTRAGQLLQRVKERMPRYPHFAYSTQHTPIPLPRRDELQFKSVMYPIIRPFAFVNIKWDEGEHALLYKVVEPRLTERERAVLKKLKEGLIQVINISMEDIRHREKTMEFLEEQMQSLLDTYGYRLGEQEYVKVMYFIFRDFIGLNQIEPLLSDPYIEDIGCDGVNVPVYVVHQRYGTVRTNIIFSDEPELRDFVTKLAERCDRYISYAEPLLDGSLPDGTRVQASLAGDVTTRGPTFSIRKFRETPFTPVDMIRLNTVSPEMLAYLWFIVENGANILITGGVATGKTSMLNCLSLFIPSELKIVSIEDTRELALPHENWIPGVARTGFSGSGVGEVTMFELLKASFRQNPDYLIVGEIRGKEAYVMFQSMASGHPSLSTMHAGSVDDVMKRLQTKPINLSSGLVDTLDAVIVMVHAREKGKSARRVKEIVEIESVDSETGKARALKLFGWSPAQDDFEYRGNSWLLTRISTDKGLPMDKIIRDIARRKRMLMWLLEKNITGISDIVKYLTYYRKEPEKMEGIMEGGGAKL